MTHLDGNAELLYLLSEKIRRLQEGGALCKLRLFRLLVHQLKHFRMHVLVESEFPDEFPNREHGFHQSVQIFHRHLRPIISVILFPQKLKA